MIRTLLGATALSVLAGAASAATLTYTARLDGAQQVPPAGEMQIPTSATGMATFTVDDVTQLMDFRLDVTGISLDELADRFVALPVGPLHLHNAPRGENGPVVIPFPFDGTFMGTADGFSVTKVDYAFADAIAISGVTPSFEAFVAELDAGNYYANLHTDLVPFGEIRGQLAPVPLPAGGLLVLTGLGAFAVARRRKAAAA